MLRQSLVSEEDAAVYAPPVAKPKTRSAEPQRSAVAKQRPGPTALAQRQLLQRTIGNQETIRLLTQRMGAAPNAPGRIQAKLEVGAVNDPLEHEADRVAGQVLRMPAPEVAAAAPPQVSRKCQDCEAEEKLQRKPAGLQAAGDEAPASVHEVLRSSGHPLDAATRAFFEPRFGEDFSSVRVHTDAAAERSARDVNANAYTVGRNVVFGTGRFVPGTQQGQRLLAHELAHVVQQSGAVRRPDQSHNGRGPSVPSMVRSSTATEIMRDPAGEPSSLWYEVTAAHHKLIAEVGGINHRSWSAARSDWIDRLSYAWLQIGAPGEKSDAELKKLRNDFNELKKEIAEEDAQALASWKVSVESYQEERAALETADNEWRLDSIKILNGTYRETARVVQIAGSYLTFDDLVPLDSMLKEKKHRKYAEARAGREKDGPGPGSTIPTGAGLGAIVTYQGKTLVRLGGEKFYISGTPPKGSWVPKGGTTSEFFIYKKSDFTKMYRLDYDVLKMGPQQGQLGWEHNQKGVAKVLDLKVTNHQPAGGWGRAAGTAVRIYKWGGRVLFIAGLVGMALEIYYAENKMRAVVKAGGALAGGFAGAEAGAIGGGEFGAFFGPVGAGIGVFVGGLIGGALGAWGGSEVTEYVYDLVVVPAESEDDWVVLTPDQVEPATQTSSGSK